MIINEDILRRIVRDSLIQEKRLDFGSGDIFSKFKGKDNDPASAEVSHKGPAEPYKLGDVEILRKKGADIENLSDNTKSLIKYMYKKAEELKIEKPVITSGMRGPASQASVMYTNWTSQGGKNGGNKYLVNLYKNKKLAKAIAKAFTNNEKTEAIKKATEFLKKTPISNHADGKAFDLRLTKDIKKLVDALKKEGLIKPVDETKKAGPHWHIKVLKPGPTS